MSKDVEYAANEAVFGMQLGMDQAVKFVMRNADTDKSTARDALQRVMTQYKMTDTA